MDSRAPPPRARHYPATANPQGAAFCRTRGLRCDNAALRLPLPRLRRHLRGQPPDARGVRAGELSAGPHRYGQVALHRRRDGPRRWPAQRPVRRCRRVLRRRMRLRLTNLASIGVEPIRRDRRVGGHDSIDRPAGRPRMAPPIAHCLPASPPYRLTPTWPHERHDTCGYVRTDGRICPSTAQPELNRLVTSRVVPCATVDVGVGRPYGVGRGGCLVTDRFYDVR